MRAYRQGYNVRAIFNVHVCHCHHRSAVREEEWNIIEKQIQEHSSLAAQLVLEGLMAFMYFIAVTSELEQHLEYD